MRVGCRVYGGMRGLLGVRCWNAERVDISSSHHLLSRRAVVAGEVVNHTAAVSATVSRGTNESRRAKTTE